MKTFNCQDLTPHDISFILYFLPHVMKILRFNFPQDCQDYHVRRWEVLSEDVMDNQLCWCSSWPRWQVFRDIWSRAGRSGDVFLRLFTQFIGSLRVVYHVYHRLFQLTLQAWADLNIHSVKASATWFITLKASARCFTSLKASARCLITPCCLSSLCFLFQWAAWDNRLWTRD